ncbi:DivIVA domain-containing protein [Kutzneria kofuensis]|uniref:Cell wall synthesis protein Wag31 n=1 Tax=Kutzneria kofuensis TaxID=103725 RepID=A0A7W9KFU6_9PSEU|nr:DivIVA domain-containing protein [Kutzneria kofuensis]MBB5891808.1 DivIVA domain-containing protein [Kutzneria kofuensis]
MPPPTLTPADVRTVRFERGPGYDVDEVDAFLAQVAQALTGRGSLTAEQVRDVVFASRKHGYRPRDVDAFLERVERQLSTGRVASTRLRTGADLLAVRLPKASHGYDPGEVEAFLARAAATLDGRAAMTASEVFHTRFTGTTGLRRGYRVAAVDALLDELEQELRSRGR